MGAARKRSLGTEAETAWLSIYATAGCSKVQALQKTDSEGTDAYHLRMQQAALWCVYDALAKQHAPSHIQKFVEEVVTVTSGTDIYRELIRTVFIATFWHEMDAASRPMLQEKLAFAQSDKRRTLSDYDSGILRRCAELMRTMRPEDLSATGPLLLSLRCVGLYERMKELGKQIDLLLPPADAPAPHSEHHSERWPLDASPPQNIPVARAERHSERERWDRPLRPVARADPPHTRAEPVGTAALTEPFMQRLSGQLSEPGRKNTWLLRKDPGILVITAPGHRPVRLSVSGLTAAGIWSKVYNSLQFGTLANDAAKQRFPQKMPVYNFGVAMLDAAQRALGP